jgi:hypothetical protein
MENSTAPAYYRWILDHRKPLFWSLLVLTVLSGYVQILQNKWLKNETAPNGIMSLEMSRSFTTDTAIVFSWNKEIVKDSTTINSCKFAGYKNLITTARNNISYDFFFIFCYTFLAIVIVVWLQNGAKRTGFTHLLVALAIIAGIMDVVENFGMLSFLQYAASGGSASVGQGTAEITGTAALIKFIILGALVLFYLPYTLIFRKHALQDISAILHHRLHQVYQYRLIFIGLIFSVAPIWILDQGQDLLVNSNATEWGVIFFLLAISVLAILNWYLSKLFFLKLQKGKGPVYPFREPVLLNKEKELSEKKVSRFLGVITFVMPAVAILNALQITHVEYLLDIFPPLSVLIGFLLVYYVLIGKDIAGRGFLYLDRKMGNSWAITISIGLILLLALVVPVIIRINRGGMAKRADSLVCLYIHMMLLSLAFYIFVSVRTMIFTGNGWLGKGIGKLVFLLAIISSVLFLLVNFYPTRFSSLDFLFMTLPLLICGIIFYIFVITLIARFSQLLRINVLVFLILASLLFSVKVSDYHAVSMIDRDANYPVPELEDYFKKWVLQRKAEISKDSAYPVFIVNTYGGGIRAAAFTSMALTYLDSVMLSRSQKSFQHYVFSISGASGGTIGAAINCAYRYKHMDDPSAYNLDSFQLFYKHDFLTPTLVADLGKDIWAAATHTSSWKDRAFDQEKNWNQFARQYLHLNTEIGYDSIWSPNTRAAYEVPLLFSNTLNVDDGLKGIYAPVHLREGDFPATIFIRDRLDSLNRHSEDTSSKTLSLMTGAFLSARFPFISPSGKMGAGYHFMDGGGKDNSGASTSDLIFSALARYRESQRNIKQLTTDDSLFMNLLNNIRFYFVSISNSPRQGDARKLVENRIELISPIVGIVNSGIDGNAHAADRTLHARYSDTTFVHQGFRTGYFSIYPTTICVFDENNEKYYPVLPLGWQISDPALRMLRNTFESLYIKTLPDTKGLRDILDLTTRPGNPLIAKK